MDKKIQPHYKLIYQDLFRKKYPEKLPLCKSILEKSELSSMDIIRLNKIIFTTKDDQDLSFDQQHRSYDKASIVEILDYQKKNNLNNLQVSKHFNLSRNTIAKWKKNHQVV